MFDQNDQQSQPFQPQDNNPYMTAGDSSSSAPTNDLGFDPAQSIGAPIANDTSSATSEPTNGLDDNTATASAPSASSSSVNDLLDIKQKALQELNPLVQHLEQSAEEKFKTTMMMIQASDDQTLIKTAYEEANKITDEKARAQALLDVVNEINYFTQKG
jgi:hypothetical protein